MKDKTEEIFCVLKNGKKVFSGTEIQCYMYLMDNQPQSSNYALRYGGWKIKKENTNG